MLRVNYLAIDKIIKYLGDRLYTERYCGIPDYDYYVFYLLS